MAVNKVVYNNNTLIDLTGDTVDATKLLKGYTAHDKKGNKITGTYEESQPTGTKTITANGTYDVTDYANATVNVPIPSGYIKPSGNINITNTNSINVTNYATAQVVDSDLIESNIKKGVNILGVVGTYDGNSISFEEYNGAFVGNAEIVPNGYNISFATGNKFTPCVCYYSLDDGTSWNDFYDIRNNANPVLTNVTQIKFKATSYLSGRTNSSGTISIPSLSIYLSAGINSTYISDNIQLTNDILDLTISYVQSTISGGSDD